MSVSIDLADIYRDLHSHPELSSQETRTAGIVAQQLGQFGYQVEKGVGGTGVVGVLRNGGGATALLRADMDALPVKEQTGLPSASTAGGTDRDGHDVPGYARSSCTAGARTAHAQRSPSTRWLWRQPP